MVGIESYHTPRNVGTIGINKADSLGQGCGKRTRGTVCTGTDKGPHMLALQIVDQWIWSTTSANAGKTSATRGFMQGPVSSEPPIGPSPQHYHRHPVWELAIQRCLVNPNLSDISRCVVAFNAYHALRNNHSQDIDKAVSSSDFSDLLLIACEVMHYFSGEIMYTST